MSIQVSTEKIILGLADNNKDPNLLQKSQSSGMKNFFKFGDFIGMRPGRTEYGTLGGIVLGYYHFKVGDYNRFCKMTTTKFGYRTSSGWQDVTGDALTGNIDDYFDACTVYDSATGTSYVVFTNGVDNIRKFDGTNDTEDMSGWTDYKAQFVRYFNGYAIYAHLTDAGTRYGFRLRTSDIDKPNDSTGTKSKTFNLTRDKNISDIMKLEYFGNYIAVYKTDCIYLLWLGSTVNVLDFEVRVHATGLRATRGLCIDNVGRHWFIGYDDIYVWASPNSAVQGVGIGSIRNRLFKNTSPNNLKRSVAVYDGRYNQVKFYVPTSYYLDTVYCFDLNDEKWSWWQESVSNITAAASYFRDTIVTIDDLTGTIDNLTGSIDDLSGQLEDNFPVVVEGDKDGNSQYNDENVYNDKTITINAHYDTGDDVFKNKEGIPYSLERVEGLKVEARGKQSSGDRLYVYYSDDEGKTWTAITAGLNPDGTQWANYIELSDEWEWYECHFDIVVGKLRYRLENNIEGSTCQVRKMIRMGEEREENK